MAQYLKDEVQERISAAALEVFARHGYAAASMAGIAKAAQVSTGNVYRYFENKQVLFDAVVPDTFVRTLAALVRRRVEALVGVEDVRSLGEDSAWAVASEELLRFSLDNRLRVVIVLSKAEGTGHEGFSGRMVRELVKAALAHASAAGAPEPTPALRFVLERLYRNFLETLAAILAANRDEEVVREAVEHFAHYHLAGLGGLFRWRPSR